MSFLVMSSLVMPFRSSSFPRSLMRPRTPGAARGRHAFTRRACAYVGLSLSVSLTLMGCQHLGPILPAAWGGDFDAEAPLPLPTTTQPEITRADLEAHVRALTDPSTEGRRAGTPGERRAADYLARAFAKIGLAPAGDRQTSFHAFSFTAGIDLGPHNMLTLTRGEPDPDTSTPWRLDRDWRPLAFSRSGPIPPSPIVFVGYGLVAPEAAGQPAIDDYAGLDVRDRIVLSFRDLPPSLEGAARQALQRHASLRYKAMIARDRGARGILFVSGPLGGFREALIPLRFDASLAGTRIAVASISDEIAASLLGAAGDSLEEVQSRADPFRAGTTRQGDASHATHTLRPAVAEDIRLGGRIDLDTQLAEGTNVLARLQVGTEPSAETIVIGAHYDHLGRGEGSSSLAAGREVGRIHPGADDNASGTALVLEIAESLVDAKRRGVSLGRRDLVFALWSGEELGLLGSNAWVSEQKHPHAGAAGPVAYLNFDMVGRLRDALIVQGLGSSPDWAALLDGLAVQKADLDEPPLANSGGGGESGSRLEIVRQEDSYLPTDTTSFYTRGVPVLNAFTGVHADYHTPRDTRRKLEYPGLVRIGETFTRLATALAQAEIAPRYQAQEQPAGGQGRGGFRVFLGTIPDYAQTDVRGVRLSGVAPDGPAERAGLRSGDVIVEVDGRPIENLYDYTFALEALRVGVPARIGVLRAGERSTLEVVPTSRD